MCVLALLWLDEMSVTMMSAREHSECALTSTAASCVLSPRGWSSHGHDVPAHQREELQNPWLHTPQFHVAVSSDRVNSSIIA